jgi:hypothetical protein
MLNLEHRNYRDALQPRYQHRPSLNPKEVWPEQVHGPTLMQQQFWQVLTGFALVVLAACSSSTLQPQTPVPFSLEPSSKNLTLELGGVSSFVVALKRSPEFKDVVNMTFEGLPDGITQRWSRDTENGDCTVLLSVDPETPTGEFTLMLKGEASQVQTLSARATSATPVIGSTQIVTITVQPTPGGSGAQGFTLAFSPAILTLKQGNTVSNRAVVTPVNGFNQDVTFSVSNLPPNVSVVVDQGGPNNQFLPSKFQAFLRFTAGLNSIPGEYIVNVTAQSAGFARTEPLLVKVFALGSTTPGFEVFTDAVSLALRQGSSAELLLRIVRHNGFNTPIEIVPQLAAFPGVTFTQLAGQDAVSVRLSAANDAPITNGASKNMTITASAGAPCPQVGNAAAISQQAVAGSCQNTVTLLRVDPKPGNTDPSFGNDFSSLKVAAINVTNAANGSVLAVGVDAFSFKIPVLKFNAQGGLETSFGNNSGSNNGLRSIDGLSSATVRFDAVQIFALPNVNQVRLVGELVNVGGTATGLAVVDSTPFPIVKTLNPGGIPLATKASLIGDHTVISGTFQSFSSPLHKCFLYVLDANSNQQVFNTYRFNPLSSTASECFALTDAPGSNRFFVGGNQQGLVTSPVVAKLKLDGELDKSFAGDGVARLEGLGGIDSVTALLVQPNGKILVGLGEGTVVRLLSNGKYDDSFSGNGIVKLKPGSDGNSGFVRKLVLGASGSIFVKIGNSIAKLNSSGVLQTDFGSNGFLDLPGLNDINVVTGSTFPTVQVLKGKEFRRIFQ